MEKGNAPQGFQKVKIFQKYKLLLRNINFGNIMI